MWQRLSDAREWLNTNFGAWKVTPFWKSIAMVTSKFIINFWSAFLYISLILAGYHVVSSVYGNNAVYLHIFNIKDVAQFSMAVVIIRFLWSVIRDK